MKSQTDIPRNRFVFISRVVVLVIGRLLIIGFQIIILVLVIGSLLFRWFIIVKFIFGIDMAVDVPVMHSSTFELNISSALHSAQTNPAIANEAKRTFKFANGNSLGGGDLALEPP